jgi:hypothetical protein
MNNRLTNDAPYSLALLSRVCGPCSGYPLSIVEEHAPSARMSIDVYV